MLFGLYGVIMKISSNTTNISSISVNYREESFNLQLPKGSTPPLIKNFIDNSKFKEQILDSINKNEIIDSDKLSNGLVTNFNNESLENFVSSDQCMIPVLESTENVSQEPPKSCKIKENWGYIKDNVWHLSENLKQQVKTIECKYRPVYRVDDFSANYGEFNILADGQTLNDEVIEVECSVPKSRLKFSNLYVNLISKLNPSHAEKNEKLHEPDENDCTPMNVMMIGYDSVSRISWISRLKKTYEYMMNVMKFDLLNGYNIVGDGTPAGKRFISRHYSFKIFK